MEQTSYVERFKTLGELQRYAYRLEHNAYMCKALFESLEADRRAKTETIEFLRRRVRELTHPKLSKQSRRNEVALTRARRRITEAKQKIELQNELARSMFIRGATYIQKLYGLSDAVTVKLADYLQIENEERNYLQGH